MSPFHDYEYTVGWICAKTIEMTAARVMFDKIHGRSRDRQSSEDANTYLLGESHGHKIAMTTLPAEKSAGGTDKASKVVDGLAITFPNVKFCLLVGIGGGVPGDPVPDIRLGDVVVVIPEANHGGVIQHDRGKLTDEGFIRTGNLDSPPDMLLAAVNNLRSDTRRYGRLFEEVIWPKLLANRESISEEAWESFQRPANDILFQMDYSHAPPKYNGNHYQKDICSTTCDESRAVKRLSRIGDAAVNPVIHTGTIASGNIVLKSPVAREALRLEINALCVEMESAGVMNNNRFKCMVVRGISDYCDTHKNDLWQPYAALSAAAYATELLRVTAKVDPHFAVRYQKRASRSRYQNTNSGSAYDARIVQVPVPDPGSSTVTPRIPYKTFEDV